MKPNSVYPGCVLVYGYSPDVGPVTFVVGALDLSPDLFEGVNWRVARRPHSTSCRWESAEGARDHAETLIGSGLYAGAAVVAVYHSTYQELNPSVSRPVDNAVVIDMVGLSPLMPGGPVPSLPGAGSLRRALSDLTFAADGAPEVA